MVILRPTDLHWVEGGHDNSADLCAHSRVEFRIDDDVIVKPSDGDWNVSAAAVYLLRTLSQPHTQRKPVAEHVFPHCGHMMLDVEGQDDVLIIGCNRGMNFEVIHAGDRVVLTTKDGRQHRIAASEWRNAVCHFSDCVRAFYEASSPKKLPTDDTDAKGYQKFLAEWSRRRSIL
jgi:hypothetical protein